MVLIGIALATGPATHAGVIFIALDVERTGPHKPGVSAEMRGGSCPLLPKTTSYVRTGAGPGRQTPIRPDASRVLVSDATESGIDNRKQQTPEDDR